MPWIFLHLIRSLNTSQLNRYFNELLFCQHSALEEGFAALSCSYHENVLMLAHSKAPLWLSVTDPEDTEICLYRGAEIYLFPDKEQDSSWVAISHCYQSVLDILRGSLFDPFPAFTQSRAHGSAGCGLLSFPGISWSRCPEEQLDFVLHSGFS